MHGPFRILGVIALACLLLCGCPLAERSPTGSGGTAGDARGAGSGAAGRCALRPAGGLSARTMAAPGPLGRRVVRSYRLYVPPGVGPRSSVPLLVSLHGLGADGAIQDVATGWSSFDAAQAAAGSLFIAVFPDGLRSLWSWGAERSYDVAFVFSVIARIERSGCVDPASVYVDGWSEGAFMAQRMACANGDPAVDGEGVRLAAVASYAGGFPAVLPDCGPGDRPVWPSRVLLSQGLDDRLVSVTRLGFPAVRAWAARWGCGPPALSYRRIQRLTGCRAHAGVIWWPIAGFSHLTWSCPANRFWHNQVVWTFLHRGTVPASSACGSASA